MLQFCLFLPPIKRGVEHLWIIFSRLGIVYLGYNNHAIQPQQSRERLSVLMESYFKTTIYPNARSNPVELSHPAQKWLCVFSLK
jgi:hypothetical protein